MAYASRSGRARVSARNPQAFAVCDRCSRWMNFVDLRPQTIVAGAAMLNINILVCRQCWDVPNQTLLSIVIPADPTPIINARVEPFLYDETTGPTQPIGQPVGLEPYAITPQFGTKHYGAPLSLLSVTSNGTTTVSVTCSVAHGLTTNDQVSVSGLSKNLATGFFSVNVISAMAFSYVTYSAIAAAALLTPTTRIVTVLVGLPLGQTQIPQVGP